ncbi:MAG TPA: VOC family protein [Candidatus Elarobacter sp.]|jgi:catechol 2,3-dioxygenase-like lactoylglutathione lyase family enzyme
MATTVAFTMYPVTDLQRSIAFYRDALGLTPTDFTTDFWAEFDIDGATFGIGSFEQSGKPGTAQSLALEVDIAEMKSRLAGHGIELGEPHELQNCRIGMVSDPDGNHVWLHERKKS